jgi:hypothetical protein
MLGIGIVIGLIVGFICGFCFFCVGQREIEKKATRNGIIELNGDFYRIVKKGE